MKRAYAGVCVNSIIFVVYALAVDIDIFIFNLNGVTANADNSFNKIFSRISGVSEYNDISSFRLANGDQCFFCKRDFSVPR